MNKGIADYLVAHRSNKPISFHMPGHKGRSFLYEKYGYAGVLSDPVGIDITEIYGADNLHEPVGMIKDLKDIYAEQYKALHTEILVNGGTTGVMASILASVPRGGKLILARGSHRAAYNAISLGDIKPVYILPEDSSEKDSTLRFSAEALQNALNLHPDASAIFITSPDYKGHLQDVSRIARIAHQAGCILIVDQAHGAHLALFDDLLGTSRSAERCGADLVIDSTHKTLLSPTGTAILNICTDRPDADAVKRYVGMLQTTSPSYPAMAGLEINAMIMREHGDEILHGWLDDIGFVYRNFCEFEDLSVRNSDQMDNTKITISYNGLGISPGRLDDVLRDQGIWSESCDADGVLLLTGAGNVRGDYEELLRVLYDIYIEPGRYADMDNSQTGYDIDHSEAGIEKAPRQIPEYAGIPALSERIPLHSAEGRIAANEVTPYPPGIPVLCPGEVFTYEIISYLDDLSRSDTKIIGIDEEGRVNVGI